MPENDLLSKAIVEKLKSPALSAVGKIPLNTAPSLAVNSPKKPPASKNLPAREPVISTPAVFLLVKIPL